MKITIAGDLGSGKSSVSKILCRDNKYKYISTGQIHRKMAEQYGVNALELNKIAINDSFIDDAIDTYLKSLSLEDENLIIDSRLGWHFVENTFKIYLEVYDEIGAERIYKDTGRNNEPLYESAENALHKVRERKKLEHDRFFFKYNVDCLNENNYDVIINTSMASVGATAELIEQLAEKKGNHLKIHKTWVSPKIIYPTRHAANLNDDSITELRSQIASQGFDENYPVTGIKWSGFYFVLDGHKRLSASLQNKLEYIPILVVSENLEKYLPGFAVDRFIQDSIITSQYFDWEEIHEFTFPVLPAVGV